jgi:hypothetical protein
MTQAVEVLTFFEQEHLRTSTRHQQARIPEHCYDDDGYGLNQEELLAVMREVDQILEDAADCEGWGMDENAWSLRVVVPTLQLACKLSQKSSLRIEDV